MFIQHCWISIMSTIGKYLIVCTDITNTTSHWAKHDDVIKWKYFRVTGPLCRGIHRSPVNSPHKGQWRGAMLFSLISAWINAWVNNHKALRCQSTHYDIIAMEPHDELQKHNVGFEMRLDSKTSTWISKYFSWDWIDTDTINMSMGSTNAL